MTDHLMEPYLMCSREECNFRQHSGEISVFEATADSAGLPPSQRILDSTKAVKKYRRSAAGSAQQFPTRSMTQLTQTVEYLTQLLIQWPQRLLDANTMDWTFLDVVNFVEDRIRAIQVDLVVSQQACKSLQYQLVKNHITVQYLLLDTSGYERQHGRKALQTALSSYWNDPEPAASTDDEMLALMCLVQLNDDLASLETNNPDAKEHTFGAGIMAVYRRRMTKEMALQQTSWPLFQWSLRIVVCCNLGEWTTALQLLQTCPDTFGIRARQCLAPSLRRMRAKALQAYNVAFMKQEAVADRDVARLLAMSDTSDAGAFCSSLHLPVRDDDKRVVVFKSVPMEMVWKHGPQRDDLFVLQDECKFVRDISGVAVPEDEAILQSLLRQ